MWLTLTANASDSTVQRYEAIAYNTGFPGGIALT